MRNLPDDIVASAIRDRADLYAFLGNAFLEELDEETVLELNANSEASLESVPEELRENAEPLEGAAYLQSFSSDFVDMDEDERATVLEELAGSFGTLFLMDTGRSVTPIQSVYAGDGTMYGESYTRVKKIMRELNYDGFDDVSEPADHVGVELDFMAFLGRAAYDNYREENFEYASRYLNLQREFVEKHMAKWVSSMCHDVQERSDSAFYQAIAQLTDAMVEGEPEFAESVKAELPTSPA